MHSCLRQTKSWPLETILASFPPRTYLYFQFLWVEDYSRSLSWPWHDLYAAILSAMHTQSAGEEYLLRKEHSFGSCSLEPSQKHKACRRITYTDTDRTPTDSKLGGLLHGRINFAYAQKSLLFNLCINWTLKFFPKPNKWVPAATTGSMHFLCTIWNISIFYTYFVSVGTGSVMETCLAEGKIFVVVYTQIENRI